MSRPINNGTQSFETIVANNYFYVDKTMFIKEWWERGSDVTLITRPRRFGKTLTLDMVKRFFSIQYQGRPEIFKDLDIYNDPKMMEKQGTVPVISLRLNGVTEPTYAEMIYSLSKKIREIFRTVKKYAVSDKMDSQDMEYIRRTLDVRYDANNEVIPLSESAIKESLSMLSCILSNTFDDKKVLILLDEYDAPLENAYLCGYWDEASRFFGQFYKKTFKDNEFLGRALITGINVIPKESLGSPFNNAAPYTVTDSMYGDVFGFTQEEVDDALKEYSLLALGEEVRRWYDGYQFGDIKDMYNPLSICSLLESAEFDAYWWGSASNRIVEHVIQNGSLELKDLFVELLQGRTVTVKMKKEISYDVLLDTEESIWGLLLSCGYLKQVERNGWECVLSIVNHEVMEMMDALITAWFKNRNDSRSYDAFNKALIACDEEGMQEHLSTLSLELMGNLDTAKEENSKVAENFYHGFVSLIDTRTRMR